MAYVVIARRWRPQQFEDIIGQEHVSKTLANSIAANHIAHSFIFTGPRGVGKTTTARILAKALNCEKGPTPTPCNECASCKAITEGSSFDVLEIDGASNRGIDEIRNLRENIRFSPTTGKYRIYIIDEVHMLTKEAFNALLKTLEEPPEHAVFIFATTEIHRVPATILSRCQRFDFKRIPLNTIIEHLRRICDGDKVEIEDEALLQIAKKADGSMRDSQSILDQIISYSKGKITFNDVSQALGVIRQDIFFKTSDFIRQGDIKSLILLSNDILSAGHDLNEFLLGLEEHFRNILIVSTMQSTELVNVSENYLKQYEEDAAKFNQNDLISYLQIISELIKDIKWSKQPQLKLELGLVKLAKLPSSQDIGALLSNLGLLKKKA
jgi:DNA polymerase-3 subunit gamma/tau